MHAYGIEKIKNMLSCKQQRQIASFEELWEMKMKQKRSIAIELFLKRSQ